MELLNQRHEGLEQKEEHINLATNMVATAVKSNIRANDFQTVGTLGKTKMTKKFNVSKTASVQKGSKKTYIPNKSYKNNNNQVRTPSKLKINIGGEDIKRITTKRQTPIERGIAFSAYLSHNIAHLAPGHTLKCDQIIINDGNAYSQYTGVFTVPQTGVYLLTFTLDAFYNNRYEGLKLVVNNRNIVDAIAEGNDNKHAMAGNTVMIGLSQGEKVWLEAYYSTDGEIISSTSSKLTTFSGVLLY